MKDPDCCKNIDEIRDAIDEIDFRIMKLFRERDEFVNEIVKFKNDETSVVAQDRQREVIEKRREWAVKSGLNPDLYENIYRTLINFNVRKELEMLTGNRINHI